MRISFANEMADSAEREGADPLVMLEAVGLDPRIGSRYLTGVGYGGSCLRRTSRPWSAWEARRTNRMELMRATQEVNVLQRRRIIRTLADVARGTRRAAGGRPRTLHSTGTNDVRDSPGLQIARELLMAGADVVAWDAAVTSDQLRWRTRDLSIIGDLIEALRAAEAAILCTEWPEIVDFSISRVRARVRMKGTLLVDGRYAWNPGRASSAGLDLVQDG